MTLATSPFSVSTCGQNTIPCSRGIKRKEVKKICV